MQGLYKLIPEEREDIYTGKYIIIDIEGIIKNSENLEPAETSEMIEKFCDNLTLHTKIEFDAVIWDNGALIKNINNAFRINAWKIEDAKDYVITDKYVALIFAKAKNKLDIVIKESECTKLNFLFLNTNKPLSMPLYIDVGKKASLNLLLWYASTTIKDSFSSSLTNIFLEKDSNANIITIHNENKNTVVISNLDSKIMDNAILNLDYIYLGGNVTRSRNHMNAMGKYAKIEARETIVGTAEQKFDIYSLMTNMSNYVNTKLDTNVILMDKSSCFMKGFSKIEKTATESKSLIKENAVLIGKNVRINSIPSMEINQNAVEANHFSVISPIDEESIFYLMSRGISSNGAMKLLASGFFSKVIDKIGDIDVKREVSSLIDYKLSGK